MSIPHEGFGGNEVFSKVEKKEVNLDDFLKNLDRGNEIIKQARFLEKQDRKFEEKELSLYEQFFDGKLDIGDLQSQFTSLSNTQNNYEISGEVDSVGEKEKIRIYGILSNLAYSEFRTDKEEGKEPQNQNLEIKTVKLDPLSFPNIKNIFAIPKPNNLTNEEEILYTYINNNKDKNVYIDNLNIASDVEDILRFADLKKGDNNTYAELDEKYRTTISDIVPSNYLETDVNNTNKKTLVVAGLEHVRKQKIKENGDIFEQLNGNFEVVDYFPKENTESKSGFGAICLRGKDGNMYFAIRGTELKDWGDLKADLSLVFNKIPETQTKDMIDFVEKNIKQLRPQEKFRVLGHSLGGALTQILTSMYKDKIDESYTFNSPGAKNLGIGKIDEIDKYFANFKTFEYNKGEETTGDLLTNVSGTAGFNLISDLGEDIGNYKIELKGLKSHSIVELVKYVEQMDEKDISKRKIDIKKGKIKKDKKFNY